MLSKFDDYPIHQTPEPVAHPGTSDKDFYERYWFNGYAKGGDFFFGIGTARYPHLGVQDCAVSVVHEGRQYAFHASAVASDEPTDMQIGPFNLEILEPMRKCRITVAENDTGFSCDLHFEGRTSCVEEPRHHLGRGPRKIMDTTRFTQFGRWWGWIEFDGQRVELSGDDTWGTKDRSWGVRPLIGGDRRGAPAKGGLGGIFFLWAPLHFDDFCLHYQLFDDKFGRPLFQVGAKLPVYLSPYDLPGVEDEAVEPMRNLEHNLSFKSANARPGNRMITGATLTMTSVLDDTRHEVTVEPLFTFLMKGLGYSDPKWVHGQYHGDFAMELQSWDMATVDESAYENQHVQHLVRARYGDHVGLGVLEQNLIGPYLKYGLEGL